MTAATSVPNSGSPTAGTLRSRNGWTAPLYWESTAGVRQVFTLEGMRGLDLDEPVCHVSYYEADAFARWAGARLPTEAEWETSAMAPGVALEGNFLESGRFHPAHPMSARETPPRTSPMQLYGDVWEWTQSPYTPYRGFRPAAGALGEYNGKFMCNQLVLRGGSCCTPRSHIRPTYRNFFPPEALAVLGHPAGSRRLIIADFRGGAICLFRTHFLG